MTLIICLLGKDAIVVASDSRASFEDEKSTAENQKLITCCYLWCRGTYTKMFVDAIKERGEGGVTNITNRMTEISDSR